MNIRPTAQFFLIMFSVNCLFLKGGRMVSSPVKLGKPVFLNWENRSSHFDGPHNVFPLEYPYKGIHFFNYLGLKILNT